jgi:hypothetical protein
LFHGFWIVWLEKNKNVCSLPPGVNASKAFFKAVFLSNFFEILPGWNSEVFLISLLNQLFQLHNGL